MLKKINLLLAGLFINYALPAQIWSGSTPGNIFYNSGNVGIGTISPAAKLHVEGIQLLNGNLRLGIDQNSVGYGHAIEFGHQSNTDPLWMSRYNVGVDQSELRLNIGDDGNDQFVIGHHHYSNGIWTPSVSISSTGHMAVGTTTIPSGYRLAVGGDIIAEKIKVQLQQNWPDYVFNSDYKLPSLKDVEEFINQHKHLPDVPSASEVQKNGIDLGDNQATLLKKIEELTLYIIAQDKKIESQQNEITDLKTQNKELAEIKSDLEVIKAKLKN